MEDWFWSPRHEDAKVSKCVQRFAELTGAVVEREPHGLGWEVWIPDDGGSVEALAEDLDEVEWILRAHIHNVTPLARPR